MTVRPAVGAGERIKETLANVLLVGMRLMNVPMVPTARVVPFALPVQLALAVRTEPECEAVVNLGVEFVMVTNTVCITVLVIRWVLPVLALIAREFRELSVVVVVCCGELCVGVQ